MDNKITKSRLSEFLAYEWLVIILIAVLSVGAVVLTYSMTGVKPTPAQEYFYYFDMDIDSSPSDPLHAMFTQNEPDNTFSFDVLKVRSEKISENYNVLNTRLVVGQGDAIFSDTVNSKKGDYENYNRAQSRIDNYGSSPIYSYEDLLANAKEYLAKFYVNGEMNLKAVKENFDKRLKGDNRFRSQEQKEIGYKQEVLRIEKIKKNTLLLEKLFAIDDTLSEEDKIFYKYTRYTQSYNLAETDEQKEEYANKLQEEKDNGRENMRYGLNIGNLTGGKFSTGGYFRKDSDGKSSNVVLMFFDLTSKPNGNQGFADMQFENLSFMATIIDYFSALNG